jgi:hypothetical protein
VFNAVLAKLAPERRTKVIVRELLLDGIRDFVRAI